MTTRSLVFILGCIIAALICFFPPTREVRDPSHKPSKYAETYQMVEAPDYYKAGAWVVGVFIITIAGMRMAPRGRSPLTVSNQISGNAIEILNRMGPWPSFAQLKDAARLFVTAISIFGGIVLIFWFCDQASDRVERHSPVATNHQETNCEPTPVPTPMTIEAQISSVVTRYPQLKGYEPELTTYLKEGVHFDTVDDALASCTAFRKSVVDSGHIDRFAPDYLERIGLAPKQQNQP